MLKTGSHPGLWVYKITFEYFFLVFVNNMAVSVGGVLETRPSPGFFHIVRISKDTFYGVQTSKYNRHPATALLKI